MNRVKTWLDEDWRRAAGVGGVLVAAIVVVTMALLLTRPASTARNASTHASASPSASESASPIATTTPSPTPAPSGTASATPPDVSTPTPAATPNPTPTAEPTPTPVTTVAGTWNRLPLLPDPGHFEVASAVMLEDGRLVVFRWRTCCTGQGIIVLEPGAAQWRAPALTAPVSIGTFASFAVGADGRIYGWTVVIDPSREPWVVEPNSMTEPTEVTEGLRMASGPDGRIYLPREGSLTSSTTALRAYDAITDVTAEVSTTHLGYFSHALGGVELLFMTGPSGLVASYDATRDAWLAVADTPGSVPNKVFIGPGDTPWVSQPGVLAWDEGLGRWLDAGRPASITGAWEPFLVSGGDRIYAIDDQAAVFIPDIP